jgi:hypothetical protein
MKFTTTTTAIGLFLAAIAVQTVQAQTKPAKLVSRDELRVCMNSESELAARRKAMEPRAAQNREEAAAIRAEAQELTEERQRIGEEEYTKQERFMARKVKPHNARVKAAQDKAEAYRADLESLNKSLVAYNEQCGGITFRAEDKEAILKERETATK